MSGEITNDEDEIEQAIEALDPDEIYKEVE